MSIVIAVVVDCRTGEIIDKAYTPPQVQDIESRVTETCILVEFYMDSGASYMHAVNGRYLGGLSKDEKLELYSLFKVFHVYRLEQAVAESNEQILAHERALATLPDVVGLDQWVREHTVDWLEEDLMRLRYNHTCIQTDLSRRMEKEL